ncbi:MAG TPA: zinc-binding alcohol dehydrogenase [Bradyrhizobium sp.]|nr:zinc-binding alcohol dehydrogenase [Bradyrhizobium sp.]
MATSGTDEVAQALWYTGPGQVEIRQESLPEPQTGELRVRALYGAISRGTEGLVLAGRVPASEYERMRAPFMGGDFPFPVKYGYSTVGRVEQGTESLLGRTIFSLHPHQTLFNIRASAVVVLPKDLPPQRAVLAANMETALNAVWDAAPSPADRIAIVGGGVVGSLVAYLCGRLPGAEVTLVDVNPARAELAKAFGVSFATPESAKGDCDLVVHASGNPTGLGTALALAGEEATVVELSWYGNSAVTAQLGGAFHSRRLRLLSSQVGRIAPSHRPRWTHGRRLAAALALLADARLELLLATPVAFRDLPDQLPNILDARSGILCQPISYL